MQKIFGVTDLQRRFRAVLDEVVGRHVPYVLTRGSRPEAALVPYEDYLRFQELEERDVLRLFDRCRARLALRNAEVSDEEVARDVARARSELD
jgi:prevent-host-death family protein